MIDKNFVKNLVEQWLEGKEYFLTDLTISADDRIVVEIDHEEGVWIEDCVELSRFIESHLDREEEDFELEVGSAGIGQPFKVLKQYEIHQGECVEVLTTEGKKTTRNTWRCYTRRLLTHLRRESKRRGREAS